MKTRVERKCWKKATKAPEIGAQNRPSSGTEIIKQNTK